jgi:hypothetical protein
MPFSRDVFAAKLAAVNLLAEANIPPPQRWAEIAERWAQVSTLHRPMLDRLTTWVVDDGPGDLPALYACAVAEIGGDTLISGSGADVLTHVRDAVHAELCAIYADGAATKAYSAASKRFGASVGELVAAATKVNLDANADAVVGLDGAARDAWADAPQLRAECDNALQVLVAAATVCPGFAFDDDQSSIEIPLVVKNLGELAQAQCVSRPLWVAWETTGQRCGRWQAVLTVGAKLGAAARPTIEAYRRPARMQVEYTRDHRGNAIQRPYDPESGELPTRALEGWIA